MRNRLKDSSDVDKVAQLHDTLNGNNIDFETMYPQQRLIFNILAC